MFGKRKNKGKKVKLTEEQKAYYLYHYGTTDVDEINDMMEKLKAERINQRVDEYIEKFNVSKEKQHDAMLYIVRFAHFVGIEHATNKINHQGTEDKDMITVKLMYDIDTSILAKQLVKKGYSKEDAERIVKNNYPFSLNDLLLYKSLRIEDYEIDGDKMVMKLEKDIFERYNKEHQKIRQALRTSQDHR